jgi:hypothetical protein
VKEFTDRSNIRDFVLSQSCVDTSSDKSNVKALSEMYLIEIQQLIIVVQVSFTH